MYERETDRDNLRNADLRRNPKTLRGLARGLSESALQSVIFGASYTLVMSEADSEKLSSYECGFDPYEDERNAFDVRFYLVVIIFLIFDIKTVFLFPWVASLSQFPAIGVNQFSALSESFFISLNLTVTSFNFIL